VRKTFEQFLELEDEVRSQANKQRRLFADVQSTYVKSLGGATGGNITNVDSMLQVPSLEEKLLDFFQANDKMNTTVTS